MNTVNIAEWNQWVKDNYSAPVKAPTPPPAPFQDRAVQVCLSCGERKPIRPMMHVCDECHQDFTSV